MQQRYMLRIDHFERRTYESQNPSLIHVVQVYELDVYRVNSVPNLNVDPLAGNAPLSSKFMYAVCRPLGNRQQKSSQFRWTFAYPLGFHRMLSSSFTYYWTVFDGILGDIIIYLSSNVRTIHLLSYIYILQRPTHGYWCGWKWMGKDSRVCARVLYVPIVSCVSG